MYHSHMCEYDLKELGVNIIMFALSPLLASQDVDRPVPADTEFVIKVVSTRVLHIDSSFIFTDLLSLFMKF